MRDNNYYVYRFTYTLQYCVNALFSPTLKTSWSSSAAATVTVRQSDDNYYIHRYRRCCCSICFIF